MKHPSLKNLFDDNRFAKIFSLCIAVLCWLVVSMTTQDTISRNVTNVPVDLSMQEGALKNLELNIIEEAQGTHVTVKVMGQRTVVGRLGTEDLPTTARITGITEPGTYNVPLVPANTGTELDYEIISYEPSTIQVRVDRLESVQFDVAPVLNGIDIPQNYVMDQEYTTPDRITVTGPQAELDKVHSCVVAVTLDEPLTNTYMQDNLPIQLLDIQGNVIDTAEKHLSLDVSTAQMVIPVLKIKGLPLEVGFTNVPAGFPLDELETYMEKSVEGIEIAGPVNLIDNYKEIRLGYINLKKLTPENNSFNFDVVLPSTQMRNLDKISSITVTMDSSTWASDVFQVNNIQMYNEPAGYDVTLLTQAIYNVTLVGDAEILETVTSDDIVAEVDLSERELTPGQYSPIVKISVPSKGLVWAVDDHSVIVQVAERPEG